MRKTALLLVLLAMTAPAYAQTTSGAQSSVNISNPASTDSKNRLITPPTVVAPGLAAAGMETCLGSASGGMSLMGLGLTFGRTTPDEGCAIRLYARQLHAFGFPKAAMALMCQDPRVAEAMAAVGQACPLFAADIGSRRQKVTGDANGWIEQPRDRSTKRSRKPVYKAWKNPDLRQRSSAVASVKNPSLSYAQDAAIDATSLAINPEEERWFARAAALN